MRRRGVVAMVSAILAVLFVVPPAEAAAYDTVLVSRAAGYGAPGNDGAFLGSISADGRLVAFHSRATNLVPESVDGFLNVFVRDVSTGELTFVSRASGIEGAPGDGSSFDASISADGRYVAFMSEADNIDAESNDAVADVFVRDLVENTTTLVSRATGQSGAVGDGHSRSPSISADGRYVGFSSDAGNLDAESVDAIADIFLRDLKEDTTVFVSRATGPSGAPADRLSTTPAVSGDGSIVAFESLADNLGGGIPGTTSSEVFVRDVNAGTTELVSRASGPGGAPANGSSIQPGISADGRYVAFSSTATNLDPASGPSIPHIFVRDRLLDLTAFISREAGQAGAPSNGWSSSPALSADGAFVAFSSMATNLDPAATSGVSQVYMREVVSGSMHLVSRRSGAAGAAGDADSGAANISASGGVVAFASNAGNLDDESIDGVNDVFVRDALGPIPPPGLSISDVSAKEGKSGSKAFVFTVTLSGTPGRPVTVDYSTRSASAVSPLDYTSTNGTLDFAIGQQTQEISVLVNGDRTKERTEAFTVELFNARGVAISDAIGQGTIRNDDKRRR